MIEKLINSLDADISRLCGCLIITVFFFTFYGCAAIGPDYTEPEIALPDQWHTETGATQKPDGQALAEWWKIIDDPMLSNLMHQTSENNLDIQAALSRIREARYQQTQTRSSLFPSLDATGSARKSERSGGDKSQNGSSESFAAGLDAGWELDIFGGNRRAAEAAQADIDARIEDFGDVMVSLLAEVALNYVELRTTQARLAVTIKNINTQQEAWALLNALSQAGRGDELAVAQARYNLESLRAKVPDLNAQIEAAMNRLAVLVGQPAGSLHETLSSVKPIPEVSVEMAVGVPANIIRQRPDIRSAERSLAAQTARTGEAVSEKYPRFTLTGSIGIEALSLENLFSSPTRIWSFGPSLSWPIFNAGAVGSNIKIYEERQEQALIQYKSVVLSAVEEVENALADYAKDHEKLGFLQAAADAAQSAAQLAEYQYTTGITDFSDVLDAQRSLLSFEDQLAEIYGTLLSDFIRLYKALGGGWQSFSAMTDVSHAANNKD